MRTTTDQIKHKFWVEGTRMNGISTFLRQTAWSFPDLDLELQEDKGWINICVYATVSGPEASVRAYLRIVDQAIDQHLGF